MKKQWDEIAEADRTHWTLKAMQIYGGGFVKALAEAARHADASNMEKIKDAFATYWIQYSDMGKSLFRSDQESKSKQ